MRRILALLLLGLFCISLIGPAAFASDSESTLPACCRRAGTHHCSMMAKQTKGPGVYARCCAFPRPPAMAPMAAATPIGAYQSIIAGVVSHPAVCPEADATFRISYSRAAQKRGPPARFC